VLGEDLLRGDDVVAVDIDPEHLGLLGDLVDDGVEGVAGADANVEDLADFLCFEVQSLGHRYIGEACEVLGVDLVVDEHGEVSERHSEVEEGLRDKVHYGLEN